MKNSKLIQEAAEELLKQIKIDGKIKVSEKDEAFTVKIETEDSGILIGFHGETLSGFQLILSLMLYKQSFSSNKQSGKWLKILVDVGDYREKREEELGQLAISAAEKVIATGAPVELYELSSFERRIVHLALVDHPQVISVSEGEGRERKLVVKLKV